MTASKVAEIDEMYLEHSRLVFWYVLHYTVAFEETQLGAFTARSILLGCASANRIRGGCEHYALSKQMEGNTLAAPTHCIEDV